jgi:hypothetical protein
MSTAAHTHATESLPFPISAYNFSNRHTPRNTTCRGNCHSSSSPISNRHLVRLEFDATPAESTTSLFLIDTKQPNYSRKTACRTGCALPIRHSPPDWTHSSRPCRTTFSNRHLVRLEIRVTPTKQTQAHSSNRPNVAPLSESISIVRAPEARENHSALQSRGR